ncbi:MAG: DNA polymerase III subunit beta [Deltaproteobacteria bacterium]|nr:DNA polymerase III subunit beta [Deltaproteobacteria bacterium]
MEFNIQRNTFLEGIQKTLGIVERKTTMPILNNALIRTENNRLRIIATDREIGLVADYDADIVAEGEITLSARKLAEMIREIQGDRIHFVTDENYVATMTSLKAVYKIPGVPADDYPTVVAEEGMPLVTVKAEFLKHLIRRTSFAISTDDMRKNLNGVFFETGSEGDPFTVRMVATDGHRLALADADLGTPDFPALEKGVIIPRKGLGEIRKLLDDEPGDVSFGIQPGLCVVRTDSTLLRVNLLDAEFPDYRRVLPTEAGSVVQFEKNTVLHALRMMNVISSEKYSGVIITLRDNAMILNSTNPDVGEANDEIDVSYQDEELVVGYNVGYLIDAIDAIDTERVVFEIGQGMKPGVIKPLGDDRYLCIVMPLKL